VENRHLVVEGGAVAAHGAVAVAVALAVVAHGAVALATAVVAQGHDRL
jgi:hypothetical protein